MKIQGASTAGCNDSAECNSKIIGSISVSVLGRQGSSSYRFEDFLIMQKAKLPIK